MAVQPLASQVGVAPACRALGVPRASFYRRQRPAPGHQQPRPTPARALRASERAHVLDVLASPRFVDRSPAEVVATLLDEGRYLCAERTMYRILAANQPVRERRNQRSHPCYPASRLGPSPRTLRPRHPETRPASRSRLDQPTRHFHNGRNESVNRNRRCLKVVDRFRTAQYRLRILEEAERCTQPGEVGRLLRREGLYSSHLTAWRKARRKGSLRELAPKKRGAKPGERNPLDAKVRALEAKVARLEHELHTAHTILDVQGKVAGLLGLNLEHGTRC